MNRRSFLQKVSVAAMLSGCMPHTFAENGKAASQPNILVIMSDEHNAGVLGCDGNKIINTPNLDGLADKGILFQSHYCNSPICSPSRHSFTAGKYPSRVNCWSNGCGLPGPDYPSLPRLLNSRGYESLLCGKMHYGKGWFYGFKAIGEFKSMNDNPYDGPRPRRAPDNLTPVKGISGRFKGFHPGDHSRVLDNDREVTKGTVEFLKNRKAGDKPFFFIAGYVAPHFPLIVPEKYRTPYNGKVSMPEIPQGHLASQPRNYKHLRIAFNVEDVPDSIVREGRELYYGLVQWFDEEVGKVLSALEESGQADNTVVIYTSDHGENIGEHGLWWKNCMYEHAVRVPLIISWPARWKGGQRRIQACSLVDVAQTIAELAGVAAPDNWNGDSMVKWMDDPKTQWKDMAISEYYAKNIASGYAMIRKGRFKYVHHTPASEKHPAERELYDLQTDPGEFNNLASNKKFKDVITELHRTLVKEIGEDPDLSEQRCRSEIMISGELKG